MAAALRWRLPAPGKGNRDDPLRTLIAGRAVLVITVLAIMSAATGAVALASSTGTLNAPPAAADQEQGMVSGALFQDPPVAETNTNTVTGGSGALTITLDASYVAPTIRLNLGAHVDVRLVNHLSVAADVHFHGLHSDPASQSDGDVLCIAPGDTYTYHLVIPADHPQGTYWYHSRVLGTACPGGVTGPVADRSMLVAVENQIVDGPSGALIVGDDRTLLPPAYQRVVAHTLVLSSTDSNAPSIRLVNGQLRPTLPLRPNETQLWRLINAGADVSYRLRLNGYKFTVVGEDGVPVAAVTTADTLLLPPAKHYDVLVTANSTPGDSWLRTSGYSDGPQGDQYLDTTLVKVEVGGTPVARLPALTGGVRTATG